MDLFRIPTIKHRDARPFLQQTPRGSFTAGAKPEHRNSLIGIAGFHYRSFNVARPRKVNMIAKIQNRTITVFSFQPSNSK